MICFKETQRLNSDIVVGLRGGGLNQSRLEVYLDVSPPPPRLLCS